MCVLTRKGAGSKRGQVVKACALKTVGRKTDPDNGGGRNGRASDLKQFGEFTFRAESYLRLNNTTPAESFLKGCT